jgi:hypothetical protein
VSFIPQVSAKLQRAIELIDELDALCTTYINSQNFHIEKVLVGPNKWNLVLRMNEVLPLSFGVFVGDVVHNLRSSLDIGLFHYLRETNPNGFAVLEPRALRGINFPVFETEEGYQSTRWHGGLADEQLLLDLREVQPFHNFELIESEDDARNFLESSPLLQLQKLWIADKHRGINLVLGGLDMLALGLDFRQESAWIQRDAPPWRDGSTLFTLEIKSSVEIPVLNLSETFALGLESDVKPLQIYPIVSKLQALLGTTQHCHWVLQRWHQHR